MKKADFRKKYRELRSKLTDEEIIEHSIAIANRSLELPIWDATYYHLFLPISDKKEVNTEFILHILLGRDKSVVVSKANFETLEMKHFLLQENTELRLSPCGIPEPVSGIEIQASQLDVVFVPLLAYDKKGNRVGYGKGFYDRFLKSCKQDTLFIGLSFYPPENEIINSEFDIPLNYCITPNILYDFS